MQDNEPGAATEVRGILDEVIATHANLIGTHYESCYLRHAGCLAVRLRDMLGPKPAAAAATTSATTAARPAFTGAEKRELIAEAEECSEREREALGEDAYVGGLLARLAVALEGTLPEADWEYGVYDPSTNDVEPCGDGPMTKASFTGIDWKATGEELVRRRTAGPWEAVTDE